MTRHRKRLATGAVTLLLALSGARGGDLERDTSTVERLRTVVANAVSQNELCGSLHERTGETEICSEQGWKELCGELRDADLPKSGKLEEAADVGLHTARFVNRTTYDLLCEAPHLEQLREPTGSETSEGPESAVTVDRKWDDLDVLWRHRDLLQRAAEAFSGELKSAYRGTAAGLANLAYGVRIFRAVRQRADEEQDHDSRQSIRFTDSEGDDLTEGVCQGLVERAERSLREVDEFQRTFAHHPLAELEVASAQARLRNGVSMLVWGLAHAVDCDAFLGVPSWLTGNEPLVPGSEVPVPESPLAFRIATPQSPLEDPSMISIGERAVAEFLEATGKRSEEASRKSACGTLMRTMNELETGVYDEIDRLNRTGNPERFHSAGSDMTLFTVLGSLSRGNRVLADVCDQDRNALRWHRRFIQHAVELTRDLQPELGELLRDLLRQTFSERVD